MAMRLQSVETVSLIADSIGSSRWEVAMRLQSICWDSLFNCRQHREQSRRGGNAPAAGDEPRGAGGFRRGDCWAGVPRYEFFKISFFYSPLTSGDPFEQVPRFAFFKISFFSSGACFDLSGSGSSFHVDAEPERNMTFYVKCWNKVFTLLWETTFLFTVRYPFNATMSDPVKQSLVDRHRFVPIRVRIRLYILMSIHIRIRILPQVLHMLENQNLFLPLFTAVPLHIVYLSRQRHRCNIFQYFWQYVEMLWKEV